MRSAFGKDLGLKLESGASKLRESSSWKKIWTQADIDLRACTSPLSAALCHICKQEAKSQGLGWCVYWV